MSAREQPRERALHGLIVIFFLVLVWAGAFVLWYWPERKGKDRYESGGLNLSQPPGQERAPALAARRENAASEPPPAWTAPEPPAPSLPRPRGPVVAEKPQWRAAARAFVELSMRPRYRRSPVLRLWAQDFAAYPDLRAYARIYARTRDLKFFCVSVLRSTNFAKMLRKYGSSPDVRDFVLELTAAPGVADSSRELVEDPDVFHSIKDLRLPGLPPLGQMMTAGARGAVPATDNEALRRYLRETGGR